MPLMWLSLFTRARLGLARPLSWSSCVRQNRVGSLLPNHVNRADDEKPGNPRKNRGIHHPQAARSIDAEITVQDPVLFARPDRATAGSVMAPGVVAGKIPQFLGRLHMLARQRFFSNEAPSLQLLSQLAHKANSIHNR